MEGGKGWRKEDMERDRHKETQLQGPGMAPQWAEERGGAGAG